MEPKDTTNDTQPRGRGRPSFWTEEKLDRLSALLELKPKPKKGWLAAQFKTNGKTLRKGLDALKVLTNEDRNKVRIAKAERRVRHEDGL